MLHFVDDIIIDAGLEIQIGGKERKIPIDHST